MKNIKKHIDNNRDLFDDKEPSFGHTARFESLLKKTKESPDNRTSKIRRAMIPMLSTAASIVIIVMVAFKFYSLQNQLIAPAQNTSNIMAEFKEANEYYNLQMEQQIADIICKLSYTDVQNQMQLIQDIQQMIKDNTSFVNEMKQSDNKELAIHYLVKHYQENIQVLEYINNKLGEYTKC